MSRGGGRRGAHLGEQTSVDRVPQAGLGVREADEAADEEELDKELLVDHAPGE
jgi:hypothetical protein